jgi:hypothetical protein
MRLVVLDGRTSLWIFVAVDLHPVGMMPAAGADATLILDD